MFGTGYLGNQATASGSMVVGWIEEVYLLDTMRGNK